MNNALTVIGALLIAALAALFAVPYFIDWNGYRGVFEEEASRVLGRDVRVGGKVNVRLLPSPYVRFEKVRIADTTGLTGEPIFRADNFTMWLSVPPLLKGVLEAKQVELKRPVLSLAVDAAGKGNWSSLRLTTGSLPFVPANVTLQAMRITEGVISIQRANGGGLAELADIEGELESDALQGPYRFKGTANWHGAAREIRLATAAPDADGTLRFKSVVRVPATANTYTLEGRVSDLQERPRVEADLGAKIGIALGGDAASKAEPGGKAAAPGERPGLDLKARVVADGTGLKLDDIAGTLENAGQPQLLTGSGELAWVKGLRASASIASRWLDLDRIVGTGAETTPLQSGMALADALIHMLPGEAASALKLTVDQVNLGGDAVAGLKLAVSRADGPLTLENLEAGLPGGARLDLSGTIAGTGERRFSGQVGLHGPSFGRFLAWAAKDMRLAGGRGDGPFALNGGLDFDRKGVELKDATAEVAGSSARGEVRWSRGAPDRVAVSIRGPRLDLGLIWPLAGRHDGLALVAGARPDGKAAPPVTVSADFDLSLQAGELVAGEQTLRDVEARIALAGGGISYKSFRAGLGDGSTVALEGEVVDLARKPHGSLQWQAAALASESMARLAKAAAPWLPPDTVTPLLAPSLFPLRLAGSVRIGERSGGTLDLAFDGSSGAAAGRVAGKVRLDGGLARWREQPVDVELMADAADAAAVASLLDLGAPAAHPARGQAVSGRLLVKAAGIPASGLAALAGFDADALSVSYEGGVALPAGAPRRLDGHVAVTAREARQLLSLAGLGLGAAASSVPVFGGLDVRSAADGLDLVAHGLEIAGTQVEGTASVAVREGRPVRVAADLRSGAASLERLLAIVLDDKAPSAGGGAIAAGAWPELAFDMTPLDRFEGEIKLHLASLAVAPGLTLRDAAIAARMEPGKLTVADLSGQGAGGPAKARLTLQRQAAGVSLSGDVALNGIDLAGLASAGSAHRAHGTLGLRLSFEGRAVSPAGLAAALSGKGKAELGRDAAIGGYAPDSLARAVETVVAGNSDVVGEALTRVIGDALAKGRLSLGPRTLDLDLSGGAIKVPAITSETAEGRTTLIATVDLAALKTDAELRVEAKAIRKHAGTVETTLLPPVSAVYVGGLGELGAIEPRLSIGNLERELSVRRMERSVEELERIRREDEERVRREQERQRDAADKARAEAERQAATQQPPPGASTSGQTTAGPSSAGQGDRGWLTGQPVPAEGQGGEQRPWLTSPPVPANGEAQEASGMQGQSGGAQSGATMSPSGAPQGTAARGGLSQADPPRSSPARKSTPGDLIIRQFQGTPN